MLRRGWQVLLRLRGRFSTSPPVQRLRIRHQFDRRAVRCLPVQAVIRVRGIEREERPRRVVLDQEVLDQVSLALWERVHASRRPHKHADISTVWHGRDLRCVLVLHPPVSDRLIDRFRCGDCPLSPVVGRAGQSDAHSGISGHLDPATSVDDSSDLRCEVSSLVDVDRFRRVRVSPYREHVPPVHRFHAHVYTIRAAQTTLTGYGRSNRVESEVLPEHISHPVLTRWGRFRITRVRIPNVTRSLRVTIEVRVQLGHSLTLRRGNESAHHAERQLPTSELTTTSLRQLDRRLSRHSTSRNLHSLLVPHASIPIAVMQISIHRGHSVTRRIQERHLQLGTVPIVRSEPCLPREPLPRQHSERFVHPHGARPDRKTDAEHLRLPHVRFRVPAGPGERRHATDRPTAIVGTPPISAVPERTVRDDVQTQQFVKRLRSVTVERVSGHIILHQRDSIEQGDLSASRNLRVIRAVVQREANVFRVISGHVLQLGDTSLTRFERKCRRLRDVSASGAFQP